MNYAVCKFVNGKVKHTLTLYFNKVIIAMHVSTLILPKLCRMNITVNSLGFEEIAFRITVSFLRNHFQQFCGHQRVH
jgi:hypothetical protein